jgi:hypothetical protein
MKERKLELTKETENFIIIRDLMTVLLLMILHWR